MAYFKQGKPMSEGFRHHLTAAARDIAVLGSVTAGIATGVMYLSRPYWEPFAQLPNDVAAVQEQVVSIQTRLMDGLAPEIVTFAAAFPVRSEVRQGGTLPILFFLKRNASCQTEIRPTFYDVNSNYGVSGEPFLAQRAPVTDQKILFQVRVRIPDDLPPGRYVYNAELNPIDCGVYGPMRALPSDPFVVIEAS